MRTLTTTQIVNYTNARLNNWYENAKEDYGVTGSAYAVYSPEFEAIIITSEENGINSVCEVSYVLDQDVDYAFNVWSENN